MVFAGKLSRLMAKVKFLQYSFIRVFALYLLCASNLVAAETNIRVIDGLNASSISANYVLSISNCQLLPNQLQRIPKH
jgi:hypothetical protein